MPKLKLQYFGYLMRRADSFEKILMLGKIEVVGEGDGRDEMVVLHHQLNGHEFDSNKLLEGRPDPAFLLKPFTPHRGG